MVDTPSIIMVPPNLQQIDFNQIRQNTVASVEPLVMDLLEIWVEIHNRATTLSMKDVPKYAQSLLQTYTLPLFDRNKESGIFQKYDAFQGEL